MKLGTWSREIRPAILPAVRTAVAAAVSVIAARLIGLPEAHWAAISTLVVMQSTFRDTVALSIQRTAGAAIGAVIGATESRYFGSNLVAFGVVIFLLGLVTAALRLEKPANRYAGITLAIIVLIPRATAPWIVAIHRFVEVTVGIVVALAFSAVWREGELSAAPIRPDDSKRNHA